MNRVYRSVWNASRACYVAAHEHAKASGKSLAVVALGVSTSSFAQTYTAANTSYERVSANTLYSFTCDDWYAGRSVGDTTCDNDSGRWYTAADVADPGPTVGTVTGTAVLNQAIGNSPVILSNASNGAIKRTQNFSTTVEVDTRDEVWATETRTATYNYASSWTANLTANNVNVASSGGVSISTAASGITSNLALTGVNTFAGSVTLTGTLSQTAGSTNFQGAVVAPTISLTGGSVDFDSTLIASSLTLSGLSSANFDGAVTVTGTAGLSTGGSINFHNGLSAAGFNTIQNTGTLAGNISNTGSSALNIQGGSGSIASNVIGSNGMRTTLPGDFGTLTGSANNSVGTISSTGADVNLNGNLLLNDHIDATGHTVTNSGTLLVSNTATPLNITGNFANTGTYVTTVDSDTGNYSRLAVSGNVTLAGKAVVNVLGSGTLAAGTQYSDVITAGGALSGSFSDIEDNSYLYNFVGIYSATSFGLKVVAAGSSTGHSGSLINADVSNLSWSSGSVTVANGTTVSSSTGTAALTLSGGTLYNEGSISGATAISVPGGSSVGMIANTGTIAGNISNAASSALNIQGGSGSVASNVIGSDGMRSNLPSDFGTLTGYNNTVGTISSTGADVNLSGNLLLNDNIIATGHTVYNSGVLLIENTSTPLGITGNFTNTGTFAITVAGDTSYSRLNVSGTATLGGSAFVNVLGTPTLTNGLTLANVISAGTLSGAFSGIEDNSYLYNFEGVYDATSFGLKIVAAGSSSGGTVIGTNASNLNWVGGNLTVAQGATVSSSTSSPALQASGTNLGTLNIEGTVAGSSTGAGIAVTTGSTLSQLKNTAQGTISGETGVYNAGTIGTLSNQAGGSTSGSNIGINNDGGTITALSNGGTIHGDAVGINTSGAIITLSNSGTISGPTAINVASGGSIGSVLNTGTIAGDIVNAGNSNLNIQGGSGSAYGLLTGYNSTVGTISSTGADVNLSGNLILNDHINASGHTVTNSGKLKVENVDTPLTIAGNFTNTGTYVTSVASDTRYSRLAVSGTADITGSSLNVNVIGAPTLTPGGRLSNVITAGGGLTGTFRTITDNSYLYNFTGGYNANSFDLTVVAANGVSTGVDDGYFSQASGNGGSGSSGGGSSTTGSGDDYTVAGAARINGNTPAAGAAKVLDTIVQGTGGSGADWSAVTTALGRLGTSQQVSTAASQTMPLMTGNTVAATHSALTSINHVIQARIEGNRGLSGGDEFYSGGNVWVKPFGSKANQSSSGGVSGYNANITGLAAGADAEVSGRASIGFAMAYANTSVSSDTANTPHSAKIDLFQLIGYGSYTMDADKELNWQVDVGRNSNQGTRIIGFMGSRAASSYDSLTLHAGVGMGWSIPWGEKTLFLPSVHADYARIQDGGYAETGAGVLNLTVDSRTSSQLLWSVDGKLRHQLDNGVALTGNVGVGYDSLNERSMMTAAFAGAPGASFVTYGADPSPWTAHAGLGASSAIGNGLELTARYDAEYRTGFNNQTVSLKARWAF